MGFQERLLAWRERPAHLWLLTLMSVSLVLPFFAPGEGCVGSAPFVCEADPMVEAAVGLIAPLAERYGDPYAIEVESFVCPDASRLDGEVRIPVNSVLGGPDARHSRCHAFTYWQERTEQRAGSQLASLLRERLIVESDEFRVRKPGQPDVEIEVSCVAGESPDDFTCELEVELHRASASTGRERTENPLARRERRVALHVPVDPGAVPIDAPPEWLGLLGLCVAASMGPLALFDGGLELLDLTYLLLFALTALSMGLVRRGWLPQLERVCTGCAALVATVVVLGFAADAISGCKGFFAFRPDQRLFAFGENFLHHAQLGCLIFLPASLARFVVRLRRSPARDKARD